MKYGIVENSRFIIIDDDWERLENTLPFIPHLSANQIAQYEDDEVEQGFDGNWYLRGYAPVQPLEEAKTAKLAEINAACDSILNVATASYPASEVLTFDQQTKEAELYQADNTASIPLLSALSASRNIPLPELVQRVLAKHHAFSVLSGVVIGQRQALEDRLDVCTSVDEVNALTVNYTITEVENGQTA